jgi:hypothetical protein
MSSNQISNFAEEVRQAFGFKPASTIKMAEFLELGLQTVLPDCVIRVEPDESMPGVDGVTLIGSPVIIFRDTIYEDLRREEPEARFTAAHEIGHALLHSKAPMGYAFRSDYVEQTDPEWQADQFAAAFLMPESAFRACKTIAEAMAIFRCTEHHVNDRAKMLGHRFDVGVQLELNLFPISTKKEERETSRPS